MLVFVVLAVFIAGLMVGRTPEFLGKKIEPYDVKMASFVILVLAFSILGFSAWATLNKWGAPDATGALTDGTNNTGPHGLSEILYAYSSATGNNGSAFAGLCAIRFGITPRWTRDVHRPISYDCSDHGDGWFVREKKFVPASAGTFPVLATFFVLLIGTILLVGALNFLPALTLGPIVEHFLMHSGKLF